jgi:hypothetical protein
MMRNEINSIIEPSVQKKNPFHNPKILELKSKWNSLQNSLLDLQASDYRLGCKLASVRARLNFIEGEIEAQKLENLQMECAELVKANIL